MNYEGKGLIMDKKKIIFGVVGGVFGGFFGLRVFSPMSGDIAYSITRMVDNLANYKLHFQWYLNPFFFGMTLILTYLIPVVFIFFGYIVGVYVFKKLSKSDN